MSETNGTTPTEPPIKIAILTPCGDSVASGYCQSLAEMVGLIVAQYCNQGIADLNYIAFNSSYVGWSRVELAKSALQWGATHLLWLDSDMVFPAWTFHHLFKQDKPVIAANYARRRFPHAPVTMKRLKEQGQNHEHELCYTHADSTGLEEVEAIGFGVVLVQAQVFDSLKEAPFRVLDDAMSGNRIGEDVYFCQQLKKAGIPIYVDHDLSKHVKHIGAMEYTNAHSVAGLEIGRRKSVMEAPKLKIVRG